MIRPADVDDAAAIARVHVSSWRATYTDLLPADFLESLTEAGYADRWRRFIAERSNLAYVVEEGQDPSANVVGFASGGRERAGETGYKGELYAIYLLPQHQGRGHGRALAAAVAAGLAGRRMRSMLVWVLRDNGPARAFYERLGGRYVREHPLEIGGATVTEVSYGWRDTVKFRESEAG